MAPKKRNKENTGLPARWRYKHSAYYYRVPPGLEHLWDDKTEFRLGKSLHEAHQAYGARIQEHDNDISTMQDLADHYELTVVPSKAVATQKSNHYSLNRIRTVFRKNIVRNIQPHHIYQYKDYIGRTESKKKANLDLEVLSHMLTKAIEWGVRNDHPMTGKKVVKFSLKSRDRYVEDWELNEFRSVCGDFLNAYLDLKGLTGLDKADLLSIRKPLSSATGLDMEPRRKTRDSKKNPRKRHYPYCDEDGNSTGVKEAIEAILKLRRKTGSVWLFCTRDGQPYIKEDGNTSGFDSIWQRRMRIALEETKLEIRFTEHDLRAKVGSDVITDQEAQQLLDHSSIETTRKIYRRKAVTITPAKGFAKPKK